MFIQTEETPNPATLKFLPGRDVYPKGALEFKSSDEAEGAPLVQRLFTLQGVKSIFLGSDFVSVSKHEDTDWVMLKPMVLGALMEHLSMNLPIVNDVPDMQSGHSVNDDDDEIVVQIKELLDTRVRPMVAIDGGDIVFDRFKDGVVFLHMRGACAGCPSSTATLKSGIENMLKHFVPEVQEVRPAAEF
jgi:Fe-S cluster biogenesis protein NfuA